MIGNKKFLLSIMGYVVVYLGITASILLAFSATVPIKSDVDWLLVSLYSLLTAMAFTYFYINDHMAKRFQGRFMALGFLLFYLGWLSLISSLIFAVPQAVMLYTAGVLFVSGYILGALGIMRWSKGYYRDRNNLKRQTRTDELTALNNRRALAHDVGKEQSFAKKSNSHLSLLIVDLDDFKAINDSLGHEVGDRVLVQFSQLLLKYIRATDKAYRWGGEEFVILLPVTALFEAHKVANKIVKKVAEYGFNVGKNEPVRVTASIGVAQWSGDESFLKDTFKRADQALYQAKREGKNSAVAADFKNIRLSN